MRAKVLCVTNRARTWYALGEVNAMRDIGANIRRGRTRRKLTQDDLAQTVHTTRQTISNYETGHSHS